MEQTVDRAVIGGGAAGFFAAIIAGGRGSTVIFEGGAKALAKVAVSGGGRCNVTHNCFDPRELVSFYPRGSKELRGPFSRFQPTHTVDWFKRRGVALKAEDDGRMFPVTDNSRTIIDALEAAASEARVEVLTSMKVRACERASSGGFSLTLGSGEKLIARKVLLATGGAPAGHQLAVHLGHSISETAPSLFTFCVRDSRLQDLSGLSMPECEMVLRMADGAEFRQRGAVLVTHWGLSGPAVPKLSAWAARELKRANYRAELQINWVADFNAESCASRLRRYREEHPARTIASNPQFGFPRRLWEHLVDRAEIAQETPFSSLSNERLLALARAVTQTKVRVDGKGVFKEEFVTCGGVTLSEVDFKTMESKIVPDLYLAGEVLDIDGVTGGFNFQAAWTTGWIAGSSMR